MIGVSNIETFGWEAAVRGMRNPMNSWNKSDSNYCVDQGWLMCSDCSYSVENKCSFEENFNYVVGPNDLKLMEKLVKSGTDHSKFMRMLHVQMDIIAPLYWWLEFDTYKVGTVANSCSKMHKIHSTPITEDLFSFDKTVLCDVGKQYLAELEKLRLKYLDTGDKKYWYPLIQLLPESYSQLRTVDLNYEVLRNMYFARKNHKLDEWREFCQIVLDKLPYFAELIGEENE